MADAHHYRGAAHLIKGDNQQALIDENEAIRLDPEHAKAYMNRGIVYRRMGGLDAAVAQYGEAIRLDPKLADAYCNRGDVWTDKGEYGKAVNDFKEGVRLAPGAACGLQQPRMDTGNLSRPTIPRWKEGSRERDSGLRTDRREELVLVCTLGEVYAESGDFERARALAAKALTLAVREKDKQVCLTRLDYFKQGKPYRESPPR